jgi:threonyl-tRNA synthetase
MEFYDTFRLRDYEFRLSIRGKDNEQKFKGDAEMWREGEELLARVMNKLGVKYFVGEGEAAFYGPKIDIQFKNLMGREETVSTIQIDYLSPRNFNLNYIDESGKEVRPVIIHRSPLSTHERFISFLIEFYGGAFPTWCAPVQVCLIPVRETCLEYAEQLAEELRQHMVRVEIDSSDNSFNKKIRNNTVRKIPHLLILGDKEVENKEVTVRKYGIQEQQTLSRKNYVLGILEEIKQRKMEREPMSRMV